MAYFNEDNVSHRAWHRVMLGKEIAELKAKLSEDLNKS